jgi:choline dehydrogenase-like flavoprotein
LVIEAGIGNPQEIENITTPAKAFDLRGSQYDWAYKTTMIKREDYERVEKPNTRGKVLGGSSCANYFTWIPGSKATFDDWEEFGGKDWTWDNIVGYLRKVGSLFKTTFKTWTNCNASARPTMMTRSSTQKSFLKSAQEGLSKSRMPTLSRR